jgi:TRAP-type transport system periplasmic protein
MLVRRTVALAALALAGCGGATRVGEDAPDTRVLTLMNPIGDTQEITVYAQEVDRLSKGAVRIRIVASPHQARVDYEGAVIDDVRAGRTDLGWAGSRAWKGSLRALHAPLLIDSYELEQRVLEDDLVAPMLDELKPLGLEGIGVLPGPMRRPVGLHGRLLAPGDFRGLAIGEQQSSVAAATLRALGARPVPLSVSRDEPGLDGVETSMASLQAGRFDVAGAHLSVNVDLWPRPLVVFANARALGRLSAQERGVLRAAAASAAPRLIALERGNDAEGAGNICRRGVVAFDSASAADLRALRTAVEPVYRELRTDPAARTALDAITALKRQQPAPPAALPACGREAAPRAQAKTRLDGTWRMDTGRSASAPEFLDENWGHWIFVFDRGRFAITQENKTSCTWGYGTFSVEGDKTTWRFTDGGGDAPNGAENKPGEEFSYRLSIYRDTATLSAVQGAISPGNFNAKPWRRLGRPARASFSPRCPPPAPALPDASPR